MIRLATKRDLPRINELRMQVNDVHVSGRPDIFKPGFCEALALRAQDFLDSEERAVVLCEREGCVAGFAMLAYISRPEGPYTLERRYLHVDEIGVDRDFRRCGVGRELMDYIREDARRHGLARIELDVWAFNEGAQAFYEELGFSPYRIYMESGV